MLKSFILNKLSILMLTTLSTVLPFKAFGASVFQETEVNQEEFIAIAQPFGENKYNLIVVEQIPEKNTCWSENPTGTNLVNVDLLLLDFDFSGHCRRSTDANGYSIRYDGEDYGLEFLLTLVEKDGQLLLIGNNRRNPNQPPIVVGSAEGISNRPMKIKLNPGWRFTKRTYEGKVLGHVYFSYDSTSAPLETNSGRILESTIEATPEANSLPSPQMPEAIPMKDTMMETPAEEAMGGNITEIVAPGIEPQKQIKKSYKTHPFSQNSKPRYRTSKFIEK